MNGSERLYIISGASLGVYYELAIVGGQAQAPALAQHHFPLQLLSYNESLRQRLSRR
jgi:hypothetical protein